MHLHAVSLKIRDRPVITVLFGCIFQNCFGDMLRCFRTLSLGLYRRVLLLLVVVGGGGGVIVSHRK